MQNSPSYCANLKRIVKKPAFKFYFPNVGLKKIGLSVRRNSIQDFSASIVSFNQFTVGSVCKSPSSTCKNFYNSRGFSAAVKNNRKIHSSSSQIMKLGYFMKAATPSSNSSKRKPTLLNRISNAQLQACTIPFKIALPMPCKKHVCLLADTPPTVYSMEGFLKSHEIDFSSKLNSPIYRINAMKDIFINQWKEKQQHSKSLRQRVLKILKKLKQLKLDFEDLAPGIAFSIKPHEKEFSKEFFTACREGAYDMARKYLFKNKFLVYDFDFTRKTALHWAAIRGHYKIMELLLTYHSDIDSQDYSYKTPMHYAAQKNDITSVKILLSNEADPFMHCGLDLEAKDLTTSDEILELIKKVRKLIIIMKWLPYNVQRERLLEALREINNTGYACNLI